MSNLFSRNRMLSASFFALAAVLTVTSGCGEEEKKPPAHADFGLSSNQGDLFANGDRKAQIEKLEAEYNNTPIKPTEELKGYSSEYLVNRVYRILARDIDAIKGNLKDVSKIWIGTYFNYKEITDGKLEITINANATEKDIRRFLEEYRTGYEVSSKLKQVKTKVGVREIVDAKGMSEGEAATFGDRLMEATKGFDFTLPYASRFLNSIFVDRVFAVADSSVIVPFDAEKDELQKFFASAFDLSKHMSEDLTRISATAGVQIKIMPGVLTPSEIVDGIANLTAAAQMIQKSQRIKKPIVIGRRTENDPALIKQKGELLVAFNASVQEIQGALNLLELDNEGIIRSMMDSFVAKYKAANVTVNFTQDDIVPASTPRDIAIEKIQTVLSSIESIATPDRLDRFQVRSITSGGLSSTTPRVDQTYSTSEVWVLKLYLNAPVDATALQTELKRHEDEYTINSRLKRQKEILSSFQTSFNNSGVVSVTFEYASSFTYDTTSAEKTQALGQTTSALNARTTQDKIKLKGVTKISFFRNPPTPQESVYLSGSTLNVDPYLATPAYIDAALK